MFKGGTTKLNLKVPDISVLKIAPGYLLQYLLVNSLSYLYQVRPYLSKIDTVTDHST